MIRTFNNMEIIDGTYCKLDIINRPTPFMYGAAYMVCNQDFIPISCDEYVNNNNKMSFKYNDTNDEYLITYDKLKNENNDYGLPITLPILINYDQFNSIHRDYYKRKMIYKDYRKKIQLLITNNKIFCDNLELKYLLFKHYILINFGCVDKFLIYEMFDINHYLSILLCYHDEINKYTSDLTTDWFMAKDLLIDKTNLKICDEESIDDNYELMNIRGDPHQCFCSNCTKSYEPQEGFWCNII
jgi:hypothetical protein